MLILGIYNAVLQLPAFAGLKASPVPARQTRNKSYWRAFLLSAFVPAILFFPAFIAITLLVPPSSWLPQTVTTQVALWALLGAGFSLLVSRFSKLPPKAMPSPWLLNIASAVITVGLAYAVLFVVDRLFHVDLRFWVVALKLPSAAQWGIAAIYIIPITIAFIVTMRSLCRDLTVQGDKPLRQYTSAIGAMALGFFTLLTLVYGIFFATGTLITGFDPLTTDRKRTRLNSSH